MKLKMHSQHEFTPEDLAETLAKGTPSDFAKFWLEFSRLAGEMTMREFAKAMAPSNGGNRKYCFKRIAQLINYYEVKQEKETT